MAYWDNILIVDFFPIYLFYQFRVQQNTYSSRCNKNCGNHRCMYRTNAHSQLFIKYINERMKSSLDQMYLINLFLAFKTFYFWNLTSAIHPRAFMWKEYYMLRISDKILYQTWIKIVEILKRHENKHQIQMAFPKFIVIIYSSVLTLCTSIT